MKLKIAIIAGVSVFCIFCAALVVDAVFHHPQQTKDLLGRVIPLASEADTPADTVPAEIAKPAAMTATQTPAEIIEYPRLSATDAKLETQTVMLGAIYDEIKRTDDPEKYKFFIELTSKGAAVKQVILSEFKSREEAKPIEVLNADVSSAKAGDLPLVLLSPLSNNGTEIYSLANGYLWVAPVQAEHFDTKAFPLDKLNWQLTEPAAKDQARFEAELKDADTGEKILKIIKTYQIQPGSYELECELAVENLSAIPMKVQMQMQGPGGLSQEEERQDERKVMTAYPKGNKIETQALNSTNIRQLEREKIQPDTGFFTSLKNLFGKRENPQEKLEQFLRQDDAKIAWAASTNKYFAAIVRPVSEEPSDAMFFSRAVFYDSQLLEKEPAKQAGASFLFETSAAKSIQLAAANEEGSRQTLELNIYLGPKDKKIFERNEIYRALQYFQTIDFSACCCPVSIIAPLAFGIIWLMNAMFMLMGPLGNYGVVIIILVFLVRLALHPITKKSQVSMMRMQKLGPKMQEIQAKYAANKQEMNKQVMAMYREQGVSPVSGMLPMFLQMPIWIALWTAVNTSIDLRGAGFLPFWITDLASPDHLFRIPFAAQLQTIPLLGAVVPNYFNLLPILMGVVMYLQQKMMPASPPSAQANSQIAQQQKMMLIMMPLLFPLMLYSGPSGVNLYIMSSTAAGVIEQKVIRKHLKEKEELEAVGKVPVTAKTGGKVKKKKPKPFFKG